MFVTLRGIKGYPIEYQTSVASLTTIQTTLKQVPRVMLGEPCENKIKIIDDDIIAGSEDYFSYMTYSYT